MPEQEQSQAALAAVRAAASAAAADFLQRATASVAAERPMLGPLHRAGSVTAAAAPVVSAAFKRGDRVSYLGRLTPVPAAAQERLEAIQASLSRMEAAGQGRLRDYLPTLMLKTRSTLAARQHERGQARAQLPDAPTIGAKGRVTGMAGML